MLSRYLKQLAPPIALLIVTVVLVSVGVGVAAFAAIPALLWIVFLIVNRGPV